MAAASPVGELQADAVIVTAPPSVLASGAITFSVRAGETAAVLGPNGAGKNPLMRMLSTLLPPTSGSAQVAGFDVTSQSSMVREHIGYVGQGSGAGHTQRAMDEAVTQGRIYGLTRAEVRARAAELLAVLGLEKLAGRRTQAMSGGQRCSPSDVNVHPCRSASSHRTLDRDHLQPATTPHWATMPSRPRTPTI